MMISTGISRVTRRVFILAIMIVGLFFVASNSGSTTRAAASICCETCPGGGDPAAAAAICGGQCFGLTGHDYDVCIEECDAIADDCYLHCSFCFSSGPGGNCSSNEDCPVNYFCAADNTCTHY